MDLNAMIASMPLAVKLGIELTEAGPQRVLARMPLTEDHCTIGRAVHGGALMSFADSVAAIGAFLALPAGATGTTTIESKSNFLGAASAGMELLAESVPISAGRRLSVWQTHIRRGDGRDVALVIQTQLVLWPQ